MRGEGAWGLDFVRKGDGCLMIFLGRSRLGVSE